MLTEYHHNKMNNRADNTYRHRTQHTITQMNFAHSVTHYTQIQIWWFNKHSKINLYYYKSTRL